MRTYCRAEMKFVDVTALSDATVTTDDNQRIGSVELFADQTEQEGYGTFELNQFILDGNKSVLPDNPQDIAFWNDSLSKNDCSFETNPKLTITFKEQHTSAAAENHMVYDRRYKIGHRDILPGQSHLCLQ